MDARISDYFSKTKGARERTSLEHTRTDVNVEEIKHTFISCQQKVGLNHTTKVRNNYSETPDILQQNKEIKYSLVIRNQNFILEDTQSEIK
jgi:hypothetical protein